MVAVAALWLGIALIAWVKIPDALSLQERRPLAQFPEVRLENVGNGKFMEDFESYTLDQFPGRNMFRRLKALTHYYVFWQGDNNGIYLTQGQAAALEYPLRENSVDRAVKLMSGLQEKYFPDSRVFVSVVPDKGYYLASANGYPAMDYEKLFAKMAAMKNTSYVNLTDCLSGEDYYSTDTHWRQERLFNAAGRLCTALDIPAPRQEEYRAVAAAEPFYGVYYGQAALPLKPDRLYTLESELMDQCRVYNYETGATIGIYDREKLKGDDLYEVFLSGSVSLLTIENPVAETDRELIVFRDSFGSAIAPLLVQGYKTVTLVDIRYLSSAMLGRFLDFHGQDVLFLYSTIVLNNSETLK
ncbi:MAG: hypothetical protein E7439_04685 [Ruminococcaceae bacterium]|nr:hypothetical protein [Oscillospiraceae bacterium]